MPDTPSPKLTLKPVRVLQVRYANGQVEEVPLPKDEQGRYVEPICTMDRIALMDFPYAYEWVVGGYGIVHHRIVDLKMPCYDDTKFVPTHGFGTDLATD